MSLLGLTFLSIISICWCKIWFKKLVFALLRYHGFSVVVDFQILVWLSIKSFVRQGPTSAEFAVHKNLISTKSNKEYKELKKFQQVYLNARRYIFSFVSTKKCTLELLDLTFLSFMSVLVHKYLLIAI